MKKFIVFIVLVFSFVSCGGVSGLTGTWTTRSSSGSGFQFRLVDSAGTVTGSLYLISSSNAYTNAGTVTGTASGSDFALRSRLVDGSGSVTFTGSRSSSGLSGKFYLYNASGNYVSGIENVVFADANLKTTSSVVDAQSTNQLLEETDKTIKDQ